MKTQPRLQLEAGDWYWSKWSASLDVHIERNVALLNEHSKNPAFEPQFAFNTAFRCRDAMLFRYARGDDLTDLGLYFADLLDAWERSNRLAEDVCSDEGIETCRDWNFDLSDLAHYNWCFWLVGLALSMDVPDGQWERLVVLIGGEGEDELLDRVIATRQPSRAIGSGVLHARPYARLLLAVHAPALDQSKLLRSFVENWYSELGEARNERLWWYDLGDAARYPLDRHIYFGRWCIEAAAAARALGIDDRLCLSHPHYPGDLVEDGRSPRHPIAAGDGLNAAGLRFGTAPRRSRLSDWLIRVLTVKPPLT